MGGADEVEASNVDAAVARKGALGDETTVTVQFRRKEDLKAWTHEKFEELMAKRGITHKEWRVVEGRDGQGKVLTNAPDLSKVSFPYEVKFLFRRREASADGSGAAPAATAAAVCPTQSTRVGGVGAGVAGCGLTDCRARHAAQTAEMCRDECAALEGCIAFTWLPADVRGQTACSLYDTAELDPLAKQSQSSGQMMCKLQSCFETGVQLGPRMQGQARTEEPSVWACQARCRRAAGCRHFTYWPDKGCELQGEGARKVQGGTSAVSGPASCERCGIAC